MPLTVGVALIVAVVYVVANILVDALYQLIGSAIAVSRLITSPRNNAPHDCHQCAVRGRAAARNRPARRPRQRPSARGILPASLVLVFLLVAIALPGLIARHEPLAINPANTLHAPSLATSSAPTSPVGTSSAA